MLARGGADVSFIARGSHLEAIQQDGLRVIGGPDPFHLNHVRATDEPDDIGPVDLVMVCVKLWDTGDALRVMRPLVGPATSLVSFQNGVSKDTYLRAAYNEARLIGGVAYVATTVSQPGVITQTGSLKRLVVGELDGRRSPRVEAFLSACVAGGIDAEVSDEIRRETWQKFAGRGHKRAREHYSWDRAAEGYLRLAEQTSRGERSGDSLFPLPEFARRTETAPLPRLRSWATG